MDRFINFLIEMAIFMLLFSFYEYLKKKDTKTTRVIVKIIKIICTVIFAGVYMLMIWGMAQYIKDGNYEPALKIAIPFVILTIFIGINLYLRRKE